MPVAILNWPGSSVMLGDVQSAKSLGMDADLVSNSCRDVVELEVSTEVMNVLSRVESVESYFDISPPHRGSMKRNWVATSVVTA
jgi:hypothetical protein